MASQIPKLIFTLFFILILSPSLSSCSKLSIYDHLRDQGLPVGLLPKGITRFLINATSGQFVVKMENPCNAKFENEVHYDSRITGTLRYASIAGLSGVTAQELFLWFPVKRIRVDIPSSGVIHFDVGVADKQFAVSLFEEPPDCTVQFGNPLKNKFQADGDALRAAS